VIGKMGLTNQSVASGDVDAAVDEIEAQTSAILVLSATGGTITADGTEQTLYIDNEPLGCAKAVAAYIDLDNMAGGDTTNIRVYHRLNDGGGLQLYDYNSYTGADGGLANSMKVVKIDLGPFRHGFQLTLEQSAGVNRAYDWELFLEM
jgi:hypothetical protein